MPRNHTSRPIKAQMEEVQAFIISSILDPELMTGTDNLSTRGLRGVLKADLGVHRMRRGGTRSGEHPPWCRIRSRAVLGLALPSTGSQLIPALGDRGPAAEVGHRLEPHDAGRSKPLADQRLEQHDHRFHIVDRAMRWLR